MKHKNKKVWVIVGVVVAVIAAVAYGIKKGKIPNPFAKKA